MIDLRPVGYVIGWLVLILAVSMIVPAAADIAAGNGHWPAFASAAGLTALVGGATAIACANGVGERLTLQQTFLLTTGVWAVLPLFAALPFLMGATGADATDAVFEAMSGLTTTGSTVLTGLGSLPDGLLLWRGMLQWFGGIGIIVVAMVFLPELRVGGMQIFRSEGFDTMGKVLPRAAEIAQQISGVYFGLTVVCALAYGAAGMDALDAVVHAMTTVSTGGFANTDASFGAYRGAHEYIATVFMIAAALPFVLYVDLIANGRGRPLLRDPQVRGLLGTLAVLVASAVVVLVLSHGHDPERALREAAFNFTSILTGTGYASANYGAWSPVLVAAIFFAGLVGGCAGSTSCSVKVFRYQILLAAVAAQVRRIHSPHGVFRPRYGRRPVSEDVLASVMAFFVLFLISLGVTAVALALTGLDFTTSVSGAAAALANIGPGLGPIIGPTGNFAPLGDAAKWILIAAMLVGRLELMVVFVLFTSRFWRA
ncbi:TrkH family potassium uptake protein [Jannaschia sp. Os4]|uniref:TrkH family potassium uptake protein n=1 Tax=Jannaschia sp. Os4 TaxID=2807617 RepID=UPI00193AAC90|nr:TrkH family potassium uptake protein [Jannaschia sp. Os4]MBM2576726.1 TrkH family potassium uptake protein [Jannaschia sp. Os4]